MQTFFFSDRGKGFTSVDSNLSTKNGSNIFLFWWNIKGLEYMPQISVSIPTAGLWLKQPFHVQVLQNH